MCQLELIYLFPQKSLAHLHVLDYNANGVHNGILSGVEGFGKVVLQTMTTQARQRSESQF